jgi:RNA polymerase sigma factor (sigma-70 family)
LRRWRGGFSDEAVTMDLDEHLPAIVAGDAAAFGRWLAGAEARVRDSLASFATAVDVEAVLQEALVRVWQVAPRFVPDGRPNGLVRLAVRFARNLAIDELRRTRQPRRARHATELAEDIPDAEVAPPDPLLRAAIADCHALLPPRPRQALDARLAGGRDDDALAESLGMRLNTFLQNFTRARQLLAECLGKRGVAVAEELGA